MFKNDFPVTDLLYFNTGSFSFVPKSVMQSHIQHLQNFESNPTVNLFRSWGKMWAAQKDCAELLGAHPQDLFLRHNVTGSLNDFLLGVKLDAGDIAVTDLEYHAIVNICRLRCERENRQLRTIKIPESFNSPEELAEKISEQVDDKIRMLMISHVMTGNGLKIPLQILADKLTKKNTILAVDGAQGAGNHKLQLNDFKNLHFYGGNFHKWFMAPKGTGFGWVPEWFHDQLNPIQGGWTTFEQPAVFQPFGDNHRFAQKMLMSSCVSFPTFYALSDLANWWKEKTPEKIFARLDELRENLEQAAVEHGWKVVSNSHPELRSPLLALELPEKHHAKALELIYFLAEEKETQIVMAPYRGKAVLRLSAHVYNDEQQFPDLFSRLAFLLK